MKETTPAAQAIDLARELFRAVRTPAGRLFAVHREEPHTAVPIRGSRVRSHLSRQHMERYGATLARKAMAAALLALEFDAREAPREEVIR